MEDIRPIVTIASSRDEALGSLAAPLDAELSYEQVDAVVRRALDLDTSPGALRNGIGSGDWVVIKPNMVTSRSNPKCSYWRDGIPHRGQNTDLRVVKSLIGYLIERCRPRRITVAEGGAEWRKLGAPDARPDQREDGWTVHWPEYDGLSYEDIVAEYGRTYPVDIVDLNEDTYWWMPVPDPMNSGLRALQWMDQASQDPERYGRAAFVPGTGMKRAAYPIVRTILECDRLISVPAMKTHHCAATLSLKNYMGILPARAGRGKGEAHRGSVQKGFVDLFAYHPADYALIEGFWSTEGNGPQWGDDLRHNIVIGGANAVAADSVGLQVMGFNPWDVDYLHYAAAKGFGVWRPDRIEVAGTPIEQVHRKFARASGRIGVAFVSRGNRDWLVRPGSDGIWSAHESEERRVDLDMCFENGEASGWAAVQVRSTRDQAGQLWGSSDGPMRVWLNGEPVLDMAPAAGYRLGEHKVDIALRRGLNALLLRVERGKDGFGFTALLCDEEGNGLYDIEYALPEELSYELRV